jgi:hypothetical protein
MAGRRFWVSTELTEVALVAATIKTVVEVTAPANVALLLHGYAVSFDGIVVTDAAAEISLARKSVAGTGTAATERDQDEDHSGTIQASGRVNMTAEGTITYDTDPNNVHPQGGYEVKFPEPIKIEPGGILGLRVNSPTAVNCHAKLDCEE